MKSFAAVNLPKGLITRNLMHKGARNSTRGRKNFRVDAFKEQDVIKDWRVKQMVDTCHVYYSNLWSRGDMATADKFLDPQFVYRDLCSVSGWAQQSPSSTLPLTGMVVGPRAFKSMIEDVRSQYPDFYVEVEELAVSDKHRIFVNWVSHGTQLEAPPAAPADVSTGPAAWKHGRSLSPTSAHASVSAAAPPSYHNNLVRGVDVITFNHDRSRMLEVNVYRQLSSDERRDVERRLAPNPLEMRLARLHWERPQQQQPRR